MKITIAVSKEEGEGYYQDVSLNLKILKDLRYPNKIIRYLLTKGFEKVLDKFIEKEIKGK